MHEKRIAAQSELPTPETLDSAGDFDGLGEELGETFLENVTGADDAATERRAVETLEDEGGCRTTTSK